MNKDNKLGMGLGLCYQTSNKNDKNSRLKKINISQIVTKPNSTKKKI